MSTLPPSVLILHPTPESARAIQQALNALCRPFSASTTAAAIDLLKEHPVQVMICANTLANQEVLTFAEQLHTRNASIQTILLSAPLSTEQFTNAINNHLLFRFLPLHAPIEQIKQATKEALAPQKGAPSITQPASTPEHTWIRLLPGWAQGLEHTAHASIRHSGTILGTLVSITLITALVAMGIGILILLILYFTKTLLGIDLLENLHLFNRS